jgi:hypothetical protein
MHVMPRPSIQGLINSTAMLDSKAIKRVVIEHNIADFANNLEKVLKINDGPG